MLDEARFFIPILTPSYFNSAACRDELEKFLQAVLRATAEKSAERHDLILPILYIECPGLQDEELRKADPLATAIAQRQRWDWRKHRHHSFRRREVRLGIETLAIEIAKARQTRLPRRTAATTSSAKPTAPAVSTGAPTVLRQSTQQTVEAKTTLSLRDAIALTRLWEPGTVFRDIDATWCPEMVVIAPGEFMMGSTEAEREQAKPQHLVKIGYPLAVGRYPVTFEEYDVFAKELRREAPIDDGWGRGRRPVINVTWYDAKAYVEWLALQTACPYRLLSEAEWEYACRAGTTTRYWWGDEITPENANYGEIVGQTSEVGTYLPNPWGLHDMHGNVWEWVEDRWHDTYDGAPDDGSAWTGGTPYVVQRGGCWGGYDPCSSSRTSEVPHVEDEESGFRVARTL